MKDDVCLTINVNLSWLSLSKYSLPTVHSLFIKMGCGLGRVLSICPSVCPSVCLSHTPLSQCSSHCIMIKFAKAITLHKKMSKQQFNIRSWRWRSQSLKHFFPQFGYFRTITPVGIHRWLQNDAQSLKWHRRGALLFFKVLPQISRSHRTNKLTILTCVKSFRTVIPVWIHRWQRNDAQSLE